MYDNVPKEGNDRIIKPSPVKSEEYAHLPEIKEDSAQIQLFVPDYIDYSIPGSRPYTLNCATCHLPSGSGIANGAPPLVDTDVVHDRSRVIESTLNGLSGKITLKGQEYEGVMPGFAASLNDEENAEILIYILSTLNDGSTPEITQKEVAETRKRSQQ